MSTDTSPASSSKAPTPRKLFGAALALAVVWGIGNFAFQSIQTRSQLAKVASKDASSQAEGVEQLMGRRVLFDALQGGAPPETRLAAIATLQRLADGGKNKEAFEQLLQMCKDPDTESTEKKTHPVRDAARAAVAAVGQSYAERLLNAAKDPDGNIRDGSREALKKIGAPLKEQMAKRLADGGLRGPIGDILASIGPETIALIAPYLTDEKIKDDSGAKITLIETLGKFKVAEAATPILPFITDADPNVRRSVITSLANIGDPAGASVLIAALSSTETDASARAAAAGALGGIATPAANAAMLKALSDYDTFVAVAAAAGLRRAGDVAAPQIAQALADSNPAVRALAAEAAGGLRSTALTLRALQDRDPKVRAKAAAALGDILFRASAIRRSLTALASATDDQAREEAIQDLNRNGGEREALATSAPAAARTQLLAYLQGKRDSEKDEKKKEGWQKRIAKLTSASPLGPLAQPTELGPLVLALADKEGAADNAVIALSRLGTLAVPALTRQLAARDESVAYFASKALIAIGAPAVDGVLPLATVSNKAARWAAVTLGQLRNPKATAALEALAKSSDPDTAAVAQSALAEVKGS